MQKGKLKILAGSGALVRLIGRAAETYDVTVDKDVLVWTHSPSSPNGTLEGKQIQSVTRHGAAFIVNLLANTNGIPALTFEASSVSDAKKWTTAIEGIIGKAQTCIPDAVPAGVADATPVSVTYQVANSNAVTKDCALLVIACDPRNLDGVIDYTSEESDIFSKLINFTFHTTLMNVEVQGPQSYGVIFAPGPLDDMNGSFYGFRNETAKQFGLDAANKLSHNLVTVYQLAGPRDTPWTDEEFQKLLKQQLKTSDWWPYGDKYDIRKTVTTPYFDHFSQAGLKEHLPWKILDLQGQKNTLFVHAFTCFESVLHCWGYANLMLDNYPCAKQALPRELDAPIVILGAGPSGLLFATALKQRGYTNVQILEVTDRYGGKTHTVLEDGPCPPGATEKTVCELGTCYLSPAYDPMVTALKEFLTGNKQIDFTADNPNFRGIVTTGELPPSPDLDTVIDYGEYVILKAEEELDFPNSKLNRILATLDIALDLGKYSLIHAEYMGWTLPMPSNPPEALDQKFGNQKFIDFLRYHKLMSLAGMLEYGYEVQGYGRLTSIPAYYGLLWMTPAITWTILLDQLKLEDKPVVTAWTKGWGDVWDQIVRKQGINITLNAKTTSITRTR